MSTLFRDCTRGILYDRDGNRWEARVVDEGDDRALLYFDCSDASAHRFGPHVDFFDDILGIIRANCVVHVHENVDRLESPEAYVGTCTILDVEEIIQRHMDVRTSVWIPCSFESGRRDPFPGVICNLSAGGIGLLTSEKLVREETLIFSYAFHTMERELKVEVIREQPVGSELTDEQRRSLIDLFRKDPATAKLAKANDGKVPLHRYGCKFVRLLPGAESEVRRYVFGIISQRSRKAEEDLRKRTEGRSSLWDALEGDQDKN